MSDLRPKTWNADLVPSVIQHDSTAYGDTRLVLHEVIESKLMIMAPLMQQWAGGEQHF
jgi:hypothetical protein